ncbi:hypothetical protein P691DRAFT_796654 [Macrolepiota fuliginosa MF-IS2]|uniref:PQ loop repeat protein n=1 Tax=Macrolepiota fuliginosa MF-IS2 TaxID=1400762 RepID=A0A9P5X5A7_9AGAR|nr:hypothetical protein P691DRAFT_796654 [Macrolepiota fuliginosa MF-IS2]
MDTGCTPEHDWTTNIMTAVVIVGIAFSYAPQHYRIISAKSSEGLSPLFLLLGSTSSAAGMWNMITMQWSITKCCRVVGWGSCIEMSAGVFQLFLQWSCFTFIFMLYMKFYPEHLKYIELDIEAPDLELPPMQVKTPILSSEWRASLVCAWITFGHFLFSGFTTVYLMTTATPTPAPNVPLPPQVQTWATFLGVTSAILAAIQYAPQIIHTYRHKVVGALSIVTMCIQSPGSVLMILSIALRPGTNWTSWFTFLVAGTMQAFLLVMCLAWKVRQRKLGIDDFGNPISGVSEMEGEVVVVPAESVTVEDERTPLIRK